MRIVIYKSSDGKLRTTDYREAVNYQINTGVVVNAYDKGEVLSREDWRIAMTDDETGNTPLQGVFGML